MVATGSPLRRYSHARMPHRCVGPGGWRARGPAVGVACAQGEPGVGTLVASEVDRCDGMGEGGFLVRIRAARGGDRRSWGRGILAPPRKLGVRTGLAHPLAQPDAIGVAPRIAVRSCGEPDSSWILWGLAGPCDEAVASDGLQAHLLEHTAYSLAENRWPLSRWPALLVCALRRAGLAGARAPRGCFGGAGASR